MRAATGGSLDGVPTLVRDPQPVEFEQLLERRRQLGQDLLDEVWEGVYVLNPAPAARHAFIAQQLGELLGPPARAAGLVPMVSIFKLGEEDNYRVPDGGLFRERPDGVYVSSAALVLEIVSPEDKSWEKLAFYAKHGGKTLIYAKFVPIVRTFAPFMAGVGRMAYWRFLSFNFFGGLGWVLSRIAASQRAVRMTLGFWRT